MGWAWYPRDSMSETTRPQSAAVASLLRMISMARAGAIPGFGFLLFTQPHANDGGNTGLLHRDAVHGVGRLHGTRIVGDHQELGTPLEFVEERGEAADIGVVERGVDLVHEAEGTGFDR
jgi:hypothetical protein